MKQLPNPQTLQLPNGAWRCIGFYRNGEITEFIGEGMTEVEAYFDWLDKAPVDVREFDRDGFDELADRGRRTGQRTQCSESTGR